MTNKLKNDDELQWSAIVANNSMNRKRKATGVNSYEKDLKLDPIIFLSEKLLESNLEKVKWLDICCGEGNALIQTAQFFQFNNQASKVELMGVDLVNYFSDYNDSLNNFLTLKDENISTWNSATKFDLITVVHGFHYIGDKIGTIEKLMKNLKPNGLLIGNLALNNIIINNVNNSSTEIKRYFKKNNIIYNSRTKILKIEGARMIENRYEYLGANDQAGPNYTGQAVVNSMYKKKKQDES